MWATLCYCGFVSSVVMPGFCEHILLQDHQKLANYMLIIQLEIGPPPWNFLYISVDLRWRAWAWPPVDTGSLSKTDIIAGAEVEGGLARTLGATVSRCNKSPRGPQLDLCIDHWKYQHVMQTKVWPGCASWVGILLWTSLGFDETACTI